MALRTLAQHHRELLHNLEMETFKARSGDTDGPAAAGIRREGIAGGLLVASGAVTGDECGPVALQHKLEALQQVWLEHPTP